MRNFLGANKVRIATEKKHCGRFQPVWYWLHSKSGGLTPYALNNDLIATCSLINGGYNGFDDRELIEKELFPLSILKNVDILIKK